MTRHHTFAIVAAAASLLAMTCGAGAASAADSIPDVGPTDTSLMHSDLYSTDSIGIPGPGPGARVRAASSPSGPCAAPFIGSDGMPVALCTSYVGLNPPTFLAPTVKLFDPVTAQPVAQLQLDKGSLLGSAYGYLDSRDRIVVADGASAIARVAHRRTANGWELYLDQRIDVKSAVPDGDELTAIEPDWQGRIWFATTNGVIGTIDGDRVASTHLPAGEKIANGLTLRPAGASVLTDHALYEMTVGADGVPTTVWSNTYDRGVARKPGQVSWGSGTTPIYFGDTADEYVAIVDNAAQPNLLVYNTSDGSVYCKMPAFETSGPGTENAPMAWGHSLVIGSTYGYQMPPGAADGPSVPADAPFTGGMTRIDVTADGCRRVWENSDRYANLPHLSRADGLIHGLAYGPLADQPSTKSGPVYYAATDFNTGDRVETVQVGTSPQDDLILLTGVIAPDGTLWQSTKSRMLAIGH
ncbi:hypothetical protein ACIRRA_24845 [Nocardia sp. NPDC101769]|uniref:hypothetical protein n=1 Tax=Nocardia sp. NPDC101769 TaxID=3364333 RepID=UPI003801B359